MRLTEVPSWVHLFVTLSINLKGDNMTQDELDLIWFKRFSFYWGLYAYLCCGLYHFYPKILDMLFWPFHYGWLAH